MRDSWQAGSCSLRPLPSLDPLSGTGLTLGLVIWEGTES